MSLTRQWDSFLAVFMAVKTILIPLLGEKKFKWRVKIHRYESVTVCNIKDATTSKRGLIKIYLLLINGSILKLRIG